MKLTYRSTMNACFIGYIVQAIVNNFSPLLFITFQDSYGISLSKIAFVISFNFGVQLAVDFLAAGFVDKIGCRRAICAANILSTAGLILLAVLPELLPSPFAGILIAAAVSAVGGGLLEVLVSPIVEACPTDNKEKAMSLLHSFYCWGHLGVVLISTAFFALFGIRNWRVLAFIWAAVPALNTLYFAKVPLCALETDEDGGMTMKQLICSKTFLMLALLMVCAGACEQAVSQWASTFAERGLHVSKTVGDLAGPALFALTMGSARAFYGKFGDKIDLRKFMLISGGACITAYLLIALPLSPVVGFVGCALCGASVGIMWPGTFSIAAKKLKGGGTAMFALLALAGDLGCGGGPGYVGIISDMSGGSLNVGIAAALIFPVTLILGILFMKKAE